MIAIGRLRMSMMGMSRQGWQNLFCSINAIFIKNFQIMKVFITGATGTLGKALIKKFYHQWDIIAFSRDELKQADLHLQYPDVDFRIGDVRDYQTLFRHMKGADAIIHAAAMKRIEICEKNPKAAVETNVMGSENVAAAAYHNGIKIAVTIGSDKGVEPINAYGMTKALQERIFVSYGYNCVRYGNVFASRGSVIPLFLRQSKKNQPLTVTDPKMTRFILTIDEAVDMVSLAMESPMNGEIFIKKSPAARLIDIAHAFSDNIKIIGAKHGEKLHEMLVSSEETNRIIEKSGGYFVIKREPTRSTFASPYTSDNESMLSVGEIKKLIEDFSRLHVETY